MNIFETSIPAQSNATRSLAVIGFVALVGVGVWLAIYATRFVPAVVNGAGEAAVYVGSFFNRAPSGISVVSTSTTPTTIFFGNASSTQQTKATSTATKPTKPDPTNPTAGTETNNTYQIGGGTGPSLYGFPDLVVEITSIGYLATASSDSFVASPTVPASGRPAVKFTIRNIGTNTTGLWRFSASIPTQTAYIYQSQPQQSLNPGDSIDYVLGFDQSNPGTSQTISITANFDKAVAESNMNNDSASTNITVLGS